MKQLTNSSITDFRIAVIIPCYNEELAIAKVVADFKKELPESIIYVFDNNSTDRTSEVADSAGARVVHVSQKGKGNVVRRMFADIEADIYLMVDGDSTYDASFAPKLVDKLLNDHLDMVIGCRIDAGEAENYRRGHRFGNRIITGTVRHIFGGQFSDMLSGYRAFSRRYVKSFPALTTGFETETELTIHALELRMPFGEIETPYGARPDGSSSKLSTYRDGLRILKTIMRLYMIERPLEFFSIIGLILASISVFLAFPLFIEYIGSGLVPRFPTAILSVGLMLSAQLALVCGFVLDTVTRGRHELRRIAYLSIQGLPIVKK
ncbi:glycosyltransferase [Methylobacter psychrophilus]|uniref:glycosyltransferase n=1 Tax=Methylobacter psychrophilus TaxID=96941 RepID=UPI0021D497C8|nr:glycosyltransferase [Methylobacter psychrophilus]